MPQAASRCIWQMEQVSISPIRSFNKISIIKVPEANSKAIIIISKISTVELSVDPVALRAPQVNPNIVKEAVDQAWILRIRKMCWADLFTIRSSQLAPATKNKERKEWKMRTKMLSQRAKVSMALEGWAIKLSCNTAKIISFRISLNFQLSTVKATWMDQMGRIVSVEEIMLLFVECNSHRLQDPMVNLDYKMFWPVVVSTSKTCSRINMNIKSMVILQLSQRKLAQTVAITVMELTIQRVQQQIN